MKHIRDLLVTVSLIATFPQCAWGSNSLVGDWCDRDGTSTFQEFSIESDGTFASWLHARPEFNGSWTLDGKHLTVSVGQDISYRFTVKSVSRSKLVLISAERGDAEAYYKSRCSVTKDPYTF
jgi:hypothetical protein